MTKPISPIHAIIVSSLIGGSGYIPVCSDSLQAFDLAPVPSAALLACGGGGSGAYRKPPRPSHQHGEAQSPTTQPVQLPKTREPEGDSLIPKL